MKIRRHVQLLSESMETVEEIEPTREAVLGWINKTFTFGNEDGQRYANFTVEKYGQGIDERIGWDTYIVHSEGNGVLGFTDGPLTEVAINEGPTPEQIAEFLLVGKFDQWLHGFDITIVTLRYGSGFFGAVVPSGMSETGIIGENLTGGDDDGVGTETWFTSSDWYPAATGNTVVEVLTKIAYKVMLHQHDPRFQIFLERAYWHYINDPHEVVRRVTNHKPPKTLDECENSFIGFSD